jgi:hypothetical protein
MEAARMVFGVLLWHTGAAQIAANFASELVHVENSSKTPPGNLKYLWQSATKVKLKFLKSIFGTFFY